MKLIEWIGQCLLVYGIMATIFVVFVVAVGLFFGRGK